MALDKKQLFSLAVVIALGLSAIAAPVSVSFADNIYIPWVWHNIGIYVRADGSVDPPGSPIQRWGNVYRLTDNVYASVSVQLNNSVFDGNGFKMYGCGYGTALLLQNANNVVVKNLDAEYYKQGVYFDNCNNSIVQNSRLVDTGATIVQSSGNQLLSNSFGGEVSVDYSANNTIVGNNATALSIGWSNDITVKNNQIADPAFAPVQLALGNYTEGIYVDNSDNVTIVGNTVTRENVGVDLWQSTNLIVTGNRLAGNQVGFKVWGTDPQHYPAVMDGSNMVNGKPIYYLVNVADYQVPTDAGWIFALNSRNITVQNWVSQPNWDGVAFINTSNSKITGSTLNGNYNAITFSNATDCNITQNTISGNQYAALNLAGAVNCQITQNEIVNNFSFFDLWQGTTGNTFLRNDFVGNQTGRVENGTRNTWDDGAAGNFWSTFTGPDLNHDGMCDSPYLIDVESGETDHFPLTAPLNAQAVPLQDQTSDGFLSMPEEYVNYTLVNVNGVLWAKIDGVYPMHLLLQNVSYLPMLYPIPPNTTNIHIYLQGAELNWTADPSTLHYTDIGLWQAIRCVLSPLPQDFVLQIHYEHPVQVINGSYTFLYDLNISPYLSPASVVSTAHFNVAMPTDLPCLNVYRTGLNASKWQLVNDTSLDGGFQAFSVKFDVISQYNAPLLGDIAFVLSNSVVPEFPPWAILPVLVFVALAVAVLFRKKP